jgi:putative aldouronate transport system substrate-binding protein
MQSNVSRRRFIEVTGVTAVGVALSACGATPTATAVPPTATKATAPAPAATAAPTAAPARATVEIVASRGEHPSHPFVKDAPAILAMSQATGIKLNLQTVPDADYLAKIKVWMATKQVPDIMRAGFNDIRDYAQPAVFQPLLPLIDKYGPNIKKYLAAYPDVVKKLKMNGDLFILPTTSLNTKLLAPTPCIRKDLVEKAGLKLPTTFDELYDVLKELKKANPTAAGWTNRRPGTQSGIKRSLMIVAYPFGTGMGGWSRGIDTVYWEETANSGKGQWFYGPIHAEFKDALAYYNKLYKEGLLDPDFANTTSDQWHEKNSGVKGLFSWDNFTFCTRWNTALRGTDAKATWTPLSIIKGTKGARQNDYSGFAGSGGGFCIGAGCKNPDRVIQLFDWQVTPLGIDSRSWGVEGTHYDLVKATRPASLDDYSQANLSKVYTPGTRVLKPAVVDAYAKKSGQYFAYQSDTGTGQLDFTVLWDDNVIYTWDAPGEADGWYAITMSDKGLHPEVMLPSLTADENTKASKILLDVSAIIDPAIDKVVLGQATMADFDKAVQDCIKAGAQDFEKLYNDAEARG